ncbi:AAA family ATPase [Candidatus Borrarchaeum sp.]|uniref:AAA family ATPase n=1 Tax=Candidatus Borrarchaeum sp. TaxID=2846742 RepID=UPI00257AA771|nr:AAA family ATPase [Candidatus Borrarchaeum sp.]
MKSIDKTPVDQEGNVCDLKLAVCDPKELYEKLTDDRSGIVGRKRELKLILSAICSGKSILLEGPPGTSKSTILHELCCSLGLCLFYCEGNADLTASKMVGYFDPAAVLQTGYVPENFNEGVLTRAMGSGGILYIEDINRVPPDALNALVTVLSEREVHIPRYGMIKAHGDFRVVASLSIFDSLGPVKLSRAILDRFVKIKLDYQSEEEEKEIVNRVTQIDAPWLVDLGVKIGRATREHPDLKVGASIRGAIDFARLASDEIRFNSSLQLQDHLLQIAYLAFSAKIKRKPTCELTEEEIIEELFRTAMMGGSLDELLKRRAEDKGEDAQMSFVRGPEPDWDLVDAIREKRLLKLKQIAEEGDMGATKLGQALSKIPDKSMFQDVFQGPLAPELYVLIRQALEKRRKALARELATQVILDRAQNMTFFGLRDGDRKRFRFDGDGVIDIDRTVENIVEKGPRNVEPDDIIVTKRERVKRACLLMIDASESMLKEKLGLAALAAAVISLKYSSRNDFYGVVAFHSKPFLLKQIDHDTPVDKVIEYILTLEASSLTNYYSAFKEASTEFSKITSFKKEIFLMTDGVWTYGEDPIPFIQNNANISRVNVLYLDPGNLQFAKELAYKGQVIKIDGWPSIVRGINRIMNTPY